MKTIVMPEQCPKCGAERPAGFMPAQYYWRPLYCAGGMNCDHEFVGGDHIYVQCYCGYNFDPQPCADTERRKKVA